MSRPESGVKGGIVNPNAATSKGKGPDVKKDRKGTGGASDKVKSAKPAPVPRETPKKMFRFIARKLPFKDFGEEEFVKCLDNVCDAPDTGLVRAAFTLEHFHAGKISRKRGEVYSSGFVTVNDESQYWKFLAVCPLKVPFLEGVDESAQPEICVAPNQKAFKLKERTDRHINTFETDPAFLEFTAKLNAPVDKLPSAEMQLDLKKSEANKEELMRSNPLLMYMREKAEKKALERRLLRRGGSGKALTATTVASKSSRGGKSRSERTEKADGKDKTERGKRSEKGSRSERREKKERIEGTVGERSGGGRGGGERAPRDDREGLVEGPGGSAKKPNSRGSRGGGGGRSSRASEAGGAAQVGDNSGPPALSVPKFTIVKRNAPLPTAGGAPSLPVPGSAPHMTSHHLSQGASHSMHHQGPPTMSMSGDARMSVSAGGAVHSAAHGSVRGGDRGASGVSGGAGETDKRPPRRDRGGRGGRGGESRNENGTHGVQGSDAGGHSGDGRSSQGSGNRGQGGGRGSGSGRGGRGRGNDGAHV